MGQMNMVPVLGASFNQAGRPLKMLRGCVGATFLANYVLESMYSSTLGRPGVSLPNSVALLLQCFQRAPRAILSTCLVYQHQLHSHSAAFAIGIFPLPAVLYIGGDGVRGTDGY